MVKGNLFFSLFFFQDLARDTPASSYIPDDVMETLDNKNQTERLAVSSQRGTSGLPPETYSRIAEISSLEGMGQLTSRQITAANLDLEKIRLDSAMTRMKYRHEDNEKRRQHEEKMERMRHQAVSRSVSKRNLLDRYNGSVKIDGRICTEHMKLPYMS